MKRFKKLTHTEKCEIYNMKMSGHFYDKEIMEKFNISVWSLRKVVYEFEKFFRTGETNNL